MKLTILFALPISVANLSHLRGKVALVTGASSGIGYAIAIALARAGVTTVGVARDFDKLLQLQKVLKSANVDNFIPFKVDVTNRTEVGKVGGYILDAELVPVPPSLTTEGCRYSRVSGMFKPQSALWIS